MKGKGLAAFLALVAPMLGCGAPPTDGRSSAKVGSDVYAALGTHDRVRVMVALRDTDGMAASQSAAAEHIADIQRLVLAGLDPADFRPTSKWTNVNGLAGDVSMSGLRKLESSPDVLRVDLVATKHAAAAESVPMIQATEAHSLGFTGKGIVVAVLDTGINRNHPDLSDGIAAEACFCEGCCRDGASTDSGPGSAFDDNGHGTNVSGIIMSPGRVAPVGVAPDSFITAIRVLGPNGGTDEGIASGLDVLIGTKIKVVNMSLSGGRFTRVCDDDDAGNILLGRALASLRAQGTVAFVASGNNAFTDAVGSPACIQAAVAVGAVYDQSLGRLGGSVCADATTRPDQVTCFSNSSPLVELLAPGAMITSAGLGAGTVTQGGTSQASPHAAGAAAVLLQADPGLTPSEIVSILSETGTRVTDAKNGLTLPRINLKAALDRVR
jgi:subtilisin family serine protease